VSLLFFLAPPCCVNDPARCRVECLPIRGHLPSPSAPPWNVNVGRSFLFVSRNPFPFALWFFLHGLAVMRGGGSSYSFCLWRRPKRLLLPSFLYSWVTSLLSRRPDSSLAVPGGGLMRSSLPPVLFYSPCCLSFFSSSLA